MCHEIKPCEEIFCCGEYLQRVYILVVLSPVTPRKTNSATEIIVELH